MAPVVRFRSAVSLLGRFPALAGVDLDVAAGEVVLVQGPNGAGKTTLLRVCAGLLPITSGRAEVLGHDLRRDRRSVRARVGLLGHSSFLYDDLTVEDNLRFASRAVRRPAADVEAAMARLGLGGRLARVPAGRLSAGQRRRVAIAALVVRAPDLWLLDEPHAGLDQAGRGVLDAIVADAAARGGTVLMASHEAERAGSLAGRRIAMAGGRAVGGVPPQVTDATAGDASAGDAAGSDAAGRDAAATGREAAASDAATGAPVREAGSGPSDRRESVHVA